MDPAELVAFLDTGVIPERLFLEFAATPFNAFFALLNTRLGDSIEALNLVFQLAGRVFTSEVFKAFVVGQGTGLVISGLMTPEAGGFFNAIGTQFFESFGSIGNLIGGSAKNPTQAQAIRTAVSLTAGTASDIKSFYVLNGGAQTLFGGRAAWFQIKGLAKDDVFLCQEVRVSWQTNTGGGNGWIHVYSGRPVGRGEGGDLNPGELYVGPEIAFDYGDTSAAGTFQNNKLMFIDMQPIASFGRSAPGGNIPDRAVIFPGNGYRPMRSFFIIMHRESTGSPIQDVVITLVGKTVKYAFDNTFFST